MGKIRNEFRMLLTRMGHQELVGIKDNEQDLWRSINLAVSYLLLDREAIKRENDYLRHLLEKQE